MSRSVISPDYNEEPRIRSTLHVIQADLQRQSYSGEVIVVDNGSQDGTASLGRSLTIEHGSHSLASTDEGDGRVQRAEGKFA